MTFSVTVGNWLSYPDPSARMAEIAICKLRTLDHGRLSCDDLPPLIQTDLCLDLESACSYTDAATASITEVGGVKIGA